MFKTVGIALVAFGLMAGHGSAQELVPQPILKALQKKFPAMQADDVGLFTDAADGTPVAVIFWVSGGTHMYCNATLGPPVKISKCRQIHA